MDSVMIYVFFAVIFLVLFAIILQQRSMFAALQESDTRRAEELAALLDSLPKKAQRKLLIAIGSFEAANVELQEVLDCLE